MHPVNNARAEILALLNGARRSRPPLFSALSTIIQPALVARGLQFHEVHTDPAKMVRASAAAHELYGWRSATLPTDLCVEAEALGARVDFREDIAEPMWPLVPEPLFHSPQEVTLPRGDITERGRIPLVLQAIRELYSRVGAQAVVGAWIPGPFTLAMYVVDFETLLPQVRQDPDAVGHALDVLTDVLIAVGSSYKSAGADMLTVHEMGGSPGVVGPAAFGSLILPRLRRLLAALPAPRILSVCGNTNKSIPLLAEAGADALNFDQTNDLARSRQLLGSGTLLFGNLDPVRTIAQGNRRTIREAVLRAIEAGADAVMPGCDLYLETPAENLADSLAAAEE